MQSAKCSQEELKHANELAQQNKIIHVETDVFASTYEQIEQIAAEHPKYRVHDILSFLISAGLQHADFSILEEENPLEREKRKILENKKSK